jgi:hypothetical protein
MECEFEFVRNYPPTINSAKEAEFARKVMASIVGEAHVQAQEPTMGAEDFAYMLMAKPGCYAFIANGDGAHREMGHGGGPCMLHNPSYDFNDADSAGGHLLGAPGRSLAGAHRRLAAMLVARRAGLLPNGARFAFGRPYSETQYDAGNNEIGIEP